MAYSYHKPPTNRGERAPSTHSVGSGTERPGDYGIATAAYIGAVNGLMHDWVVGWVNATMEQVADKLLLSRYKIAM